MSVVQSYSTQFTSQQDLGNYFAEDLISSPNGFFLAADFVFGTTTTIFHSFSNVNTTLSTIKTGIAGTNASLTGMIYGNGHIMVVTETGTGLHLQDASASNGANFAFAPGASEPDIVAVTGGGMVIAAELAGHIQIYRKTSTGTAIADFTVDTNANVDANPSVAALADGGFAVAWDRTVGTATELWAAVYNADGSVRKAAAALDTVGEFNRMPDVQPLASGGFVVAYENDAGVDSFGDQQTQVALAILDAAGAPVSTILTPAWVNQGPSRPHVSQIANGWLVVTADNDWFGSFSDTDVNGFIIDPATGNFIVGGPFPQLIRGEDGLQGYNLNAASNTEDGRSLVVYADDQDDFVGMRAVTQLIVVTSTGDDANDTAVGSGLIDIMSGGGGNDQLSGGGSNDSLTGGPGDDVLDGGAGNDTMIGGEGVDVYHVDSAGDVVTETADDASRDTVYASVYYELPDNVENLFLTGSVDIGVGNGLDNRLVGNDVNNRLDGLGGNDLIDGKLGADNMRGGTGDDLYTVDNVGDRTRENADEGIDTVRSFITLTLADNVEILQLQGTDNINGSGNGLDNTLNGNNGNNILDGGLGADHMTGAAGDDTYVVDNVGDVVSDGANQGYDNVKSSVSYTLGNNIEALLLIGADSLDGVGNGQANAITGNNGNNVLDGKGGADVLYGGKGDDIYYVDDPGDILTESNGQGTDTVVSSLSYTLANNFEDLTLTGGARLNGTGNGLANMITGNEANNVLDGQKGNDILTGGAGNDFFAFSTKLDAVANVDAVTDFASGSDYVKLSQAIFSALPLGGLAADAFFEGPAALTASQHILYDQASGVVSYDRDGSGSAAAVAFAQLTPGQALSYGDFIVS